MFHVGILVYNGSSDSNTRGLWLSYTNVVATRKALVFFEAKVRTRIRKAYYFSPLGEIYKSIHAVFPSNFLLVR